jgi:YD repeat-containing protein
MNTVGRIPRVLLFLIIVAFTCPYVSGAATYRYDDDGRLIEASLESGVTISYIYDAAGNRLNRVITFAVAPPGDINGDGEIDLRDAIISLQIAAGITPTTPVYSDADVNGDGALGLAETLYIMGEMAP